MPVRAVAVLALAACNSGSGTASGTDRAPAGSDAGTTAGGACVEWTRQLGSQGGTVGLSVATDGVGGVYVTGHTSGSLDGNVFAGGLDMFVTKYNAAGVKQWTRQLGSASNEQGLGVATDGVGGVYVTGYTRGSLDGNVFAGMLDVFVTKYDAAGGKQWTRQLGSAGHDLPGGVA